MEIERIESRQRETIRRHDPVGRRDSGARSSMRRLRFVRLALLTPLLGAFLGCSDLLVVELPTKIGSDALENPALAGTLVNSALGDFECAFTDYVAATGEIAGELRHSTGWYTYTPWDHRSVGPNEDVGPCDRSLGYGLYRPLQTARVQAREARERIDAFPADKVPNRESLRATALAYEGYSLTLLGEGWCEMAIDESAIMQPPEVLALAEARFLEAIADAQASGNTDILNTARVGLARVRLDLGKNAEAAEVAADVPEGFERLVTRGSSGHRRWNGVYQDNIANKYISVDRSYADLEWMGVPDPRVTVVPGGQGHDQTETLAQTKYTSVSSPMVLASWAEAQLIIAEARGGQEAVDIINALHDRAGLPPFSGGSEEAILGHVLQERARELFLEGHRLNDMLRHDLPFKTGIAPHDGVPYGNTTCMVLPQIEIDANPNI